MTLLGLIESSYQLDRNQTTLDRVGCVPRLGSRESMLLELEHLVRFVEKREGVLAVCLHWGHLAHHPNGRGLHQLLVGDLLASDDQWGLCTNRSVTPLERDWMVQID